MPELPDVAVYVERLGELLGGQPLERARLKSAFLLRSFDPPLSELEGKRVTATSRLGKRIIIEFEEQLLLVLHLMIAGRLHWRPRGVALSRKSDLLALDFPTGSLLLTEAGTKKRASLHVVRGSDALSEFDRGGIEPFACTREEFAQAMRRENRTLKRALTDPRLVSGVGNAYSDEILHRAGLSPLKRTHALDDGELARLHEATRSVLGEWLVRLRAEAQGGFPEKVTAFRPEMAVHGKYRKPCPVCGTPVQRIVYAANEANYCPKCQTGGRLLADRALSRLLGEDWPRSLEELEELKLRAKR
ncbi:MAG TPA: DNA-formamidopyrimidine glycosylase family protein [Polyangiaceae bacterium]|nr:DNA-formamidopyrimidine glycosylase family protein [Polyangiaceae bacterium]